MEAWALWAPPHALTAARAWLPAALAPRPAAQGEQAVDTGYETRRGGEGGGERPGRCPCAEAGGGGSGGREAEAGEGRLAAAGRADGGRADGGGAGARAHPSCRGSGVGSLTRRQVSRPPRSGSARWGSDYLGSPCVSGEASSTPDEAAH